MDRAVALEEKPVAEAQAWRISFETAPPQGRPALLAIQEPRTLWALSHPLPVAEVLAGAGSRADQSPSHETNDSANSGAGRRNLERQPMADFDGFDGCPLVLVWLPAKLVNPHEIDRRAEAWVAAANRSQGVIRAGLSTVRVLWFNDRAVVYCSIEQLTDAMDAVIRFTIAARQAAVIERRMAATWPAIEAHRSLGHAVRWRQQKLQPQVNLMTENAIGMKADHLRIQTAIEQLDPALSSISKRLYAELVLQANLYERLEMLEDPIQFALDHYELANTRLIEAKNAGIEVIMMGLILVFFAAQIVEMLLH